MDIDSIIVNSDTNYILAFIIVIYTAKLLQEKSEDSLIKNRSKKAKMIQNIFFLPAVVYISYHNLQLGIILSILYVSLNL
tara:strand:- start:44 stop:283 length:240 start_codon:yes stop_codon:yes gene_type:complete